jgi:hypothetical protein
LSATAIATTLLAALIGITASPTAAAAAPAAIPIGTTIHGPATPYDTPGVGACGEPVHPRHTALVAVPAAYWTATNPNHDPICRR